MKIIYILLFSTFYFLSIALVSAFDIKTDTSITLWGKSDIKKSISSIPISVDRYSNEFTQYKKRLFLSWSIFTSEIYWYFNVDDNKKMFLYLSEESHEECDNELTYYFSWSIINDDWWVWYTTVKDKDNYFCPDTWKFSIHLESKKDNKSFFENIVLKSWNILFGKWEDLPWITLTVKDSKNRDIIINETALFDNTKVSIAWSINKNNIEVIWEFTWWTEAQMNSRNIIWIDQSEMVTNEQWVVLWRLGDFNKQIKQQVIKHTLLREWNTLSSNTTITNINDDFILYEANSEWTEHGDWNKWYILTLWNGWQIWVEWDRTIIVKGWNLYIKSDLYYVNNNSMLTIIVLRDENNKLQWWNVYIDPYVTNIDANIISEWSLLSYNWTILNSVENSSNLRNQLLIYWTLYSRNTIGENIAPYWSDKNISNNYNEKDSYNYNLENLRSFQVISSTSVTWDCNNPNNVTAMLEEWKALKNAFAWKKECHITDDSKPWLRSTHRTASLVIEYNNNIQLNPPRIFR